MRDLVTAPDRRASLVAAGLWTNETLAARLLHHATIAPDSLAVVDGMDGREISYGRLARDVRALTSFLASNGIGAGDTVAVQLPNRYEAVVADLAVLLLGGVLNPLLPNYRAHELRHILNVGRARAIITPDTYRNFDFIDMLHGIRGELPGLTLHMVSGISSDLPTLAGALAADGGEGLEPDRPAEAISEVIFTSGTEATPKAVLHTEQTTNFAVRNTMEYLGMGANDCVWMPSPVGHSTGLNFGVRFAVFHGLPLILQDVWDPERALELIARYRCSYTLAATTFLTDLVRAASRQPTDLTSMRYFCCGGAPVSGDLVRAASKHGIGVLRLYGSTELLGVSWAPPDAPLEKLAAADGALMPHVEMQVWDEADCPVQPGVPGEAVVRSPSCSVGFLDDPERTGSTFLPGGWVRSGDLVTLDDDGYVTVVGRKKEIIIRGGLNIAPREIEDVLVSMPGIDAVAVIGVPDDRLGEITCACVVASDAAAVSLESVVAYLEQHGVAKYKFPQRLALVPRLPMTASGKVQKHILRAEILREAP